MIPVAKQATLESDSAFLTEDPAQGIPPSEAYRREEVPMASRMTPPSTPPTMQPTTVAAPKKMSA